MEELANKYLKRKQKDPLEDLSYPSAPSPEIAEFDPKSFERELANILKPKRTHQNSPFQTKVTFTSKRLTSP